MNKLKLIGIVFLLIFSIGIVNATPEETLVNDILLYTTLGADGIDISGNGHDMSHVNPVSIADSTSHLTDDTLAYGQWSDYSGAGQYTETDGSISLSTSEITFDGYFLASSTQSALDGILSIDDTSSNRFAHMRIDNNNGGRIDLIFWINGNVRIFSTSGTDYSDGVKHHFSASYNGTTALLYIDNNLVINNSDYSGSLTTVNTKFRIGFTPSANYWQGYIKDVGIWTRTLTTEERELRYNSGEGYRPNLLKKNALQYYKLNGNSNTEVPGGINGTDTDVTYSSGGVIDQDATFNGVSSQILLNTVFPTPTSALWKKTSGGSYEFVSLTNSNYYTNTVDIDPDFYPISATQPTGSVIIGKYDFFSAYFDGDIDEVMLFTQNMGISMDLHRWLYNGGSPTQTQQYPFEFTLTDGCVYSGTGDWIISENCTITSNYTLETGKTLFVTGTNTVLVSSGVVIN